MSPLDINEKLVKKLLVDFIRQEVGKAGFSWGIIGLSGGLDSTVTAYLSAEALGKEKILGVLLPYAESRKDSLEDARLVSDKLGIRCETFDITGMVEAYLTQSPGLDLIRKGNLLARARMMVLYDLSAREKGLVIGTSNKTELLLGYGTLHGDMAAALVPLGDLYKTQVRQLARHLKVPQKILNKVPTADLWVGQTDEGELGFSYPQMDRLLVLMVDGRYSEPELEEAGFSREFINAIRAKIKGSQFKRLLPLIPKISSRTVGSDFLYVRDWGR